MSFSKTAILGWLMTIVGFLGIIGVDFPVDQIETLLSRITDDILELWLLISGPVALWMRKITNSPVAAGILGWLGLKEKKEESNVPKS